MTAKNPNTWVRRCGGYRVRRWRGKIVVFCRRCGRAGAFSPRNARLLARELRGPLSRFVIAAPRPDRTALADLLDRAARGARR